MIREAVPWQALPIVGFLLHDCPMEGPSDGDREQGAPSSDADLQIEYQIMLAEYSALHRDR